MNIGENNLLKEGAKALSNGDAFKKILTLNIEGNDINDYGLYLLSTGKLSEIEELFLGKNKLGDESVAYIYNFKKLEKLDLESNLLTSKGAYYLCGKNFDNINHY